MLVYLTPKFCHHVSFMSRVCMGNAFAIIAIVIWQSGQMSRFMRVHPRICVSLPDPAISPTNIGTVFLISDCDIILIMEPRGKPVGTGLLNSRGHFCVHIAASFFVSTPVLLDGALDIFCNRFHLFV